MRGNESEQAGAAEEKVATNTWVACSQEAQSSTTRRRVVRLHVVAKYKCRALNCQEQAKWQVGSFFNHSVSVEINRSYLTVKIFGSNVIYITLVSYNHYYYHHLLTILDQE